MKKHFDDIIKDKLNQVKYEFNASSWDSLESKLTKSKNSSESVFNTYLVGAVAATGLMALVISNAPNIGKSDSPPINENPKEVFISNEPEVSDVVVVESVNFDLQQEHEIALKPSQTTPTKIGNKVGAVEAEKTAESNGSTPKSSETNKLIDQTNGELPNQTISMDFTATGIQCEGRKIKFQTTQNAPKGSVQWLIDDVYVLDGNSAEFKFETAGKHTAKLIYQSSKNESPIVVVKELEIFENPSFDINIESPEFSDCYNKEVVFSASPSNISYSWTINGNAYGKAGKITQKLPEGWYNVVVQGVNEHGCSSKETASYDHRSGINIYIESAFTPTNNDNENDDILPTNLDKMASFTFRVINPYSGVIVYETNELKPWDGSIRNTSERVHSGEFYMIEVIATDLCGMTKSYSQKITVL